jgi:hypothetical protein
MQTDQQTTNRTLTLYYVLVVAVVTALYRLAPYYLLNDPTKVHLVWNLSAVGALSLFAGSRLRQRWAFLVPLGTMIVSDLLLIAPMNTLTPPRSPFTWGTPIIYASFLVYVFAGRMVKQDEMSGMVIGGAALLASVQFFLITNFAVWPNSTLYPQTFGGLLECYVAAVPFYRGTLLGDLVFSGLIFGVHAVLVRSASWEKARQPA